MKASCESVCLQLPSCIAECAVLSDCSLEKIFVEKQTLIETWFRQQWRKTPAVVTSSVDLRHEGFRLAPVDTNLFPAGFNNLNPNFFPLYIQAAQSVINEKMPGCTRILIIPENHTRNPFYFESLVNLHTIFSKAGFEVRIGSLIEGLTESQPIPNSSLFLEPLIQKNNRLQLKDFNPCMIVLNNDLSAGIPSIFQGIQQPIYPNPELGWSSRLKSQHFTHYADITQEFSQLIHIDSWLITPFFKACTELDFMESTGIEALADAIETLFNQIRQKYNEYGIKQEPFVVVKADAGTYGMGITMVKSAQEILALNRKQRTKMSMSKGNQKIQKVIIQEGIYTFETAGTPPNEGVAEPVIYMLGQYVIGGFYRIHKDKRKDENLNTPGMHFEPLAFNAACNNPESHPMSRRFYAYGVIARLAALAAAREAAEIRKEIKTS